MTSLLKIPSPATAMKSGKGRQTAPAQEFVLPYLQSLENYDSRGTSLGI